MDEMTTEALKKHPLPEEVLFWWIIAYLGIEIPVDTANPLVSPLLGDFHDFPPMLVQASPCEILFEGNKMLVEKAQDAGVDVTLQTWDGMIHVWQLYMLGELPEAREAIDRIGEWVQYLFAKS